MKEPEATEDARRALGAELAAYRTAAGFNQDRLAELTSYSRSTIANVETGRQKVRRPFWERADTALRTGGVLASAYDEMQASLRQHRQAAARQVSAARQMRLPQADESEHPEGADLPSINLIPAAETTRPQDGDIAWADGDGSARRVHPGDVIRLRGMCEQLKNIDNAHGGGAALPMTMGYLRHEAPLLRGLQQAHPADRALIDVFALFFLDAGWMAYDAAEQQLATENFTRALRLAHAAGDRLLGARVLAAMSHQAIYLGQVRQAIDYARAARAATRIVATPRTVAMLAAMQACAHAAAGDASACCNALDEAAQAVTEIRARPEPESLDFDEGGYWGHAARAYRDLGRLAEAEQCAQKSVGLCLPAHGRTRAQRYAIHAAAHLRMGEIDAAAAAGEHIVREAWTLHSSHVFGEVAHLARQLSQHKSPVAAAFLDQARELLDARGPKADPAST